jgi:hypothetical protein
VTCISFLLTRLGDGWDMACEDKSQPVSQSSAIYHFHITSVHDSRRCKDGETSRLQDSIRIAVQLVEGTVATNTNINTDIKSTLGGLSKQRSRQGNRIQHGSRKIRRKPRE